MATFLTRNLRDPHTGKFSGREIWLRFRALLAIFVSVGVLGAGVYVVYDWASNSWTEFKTADDYEGDGKDNAKVEIAIPSGSTGAKIAEILVQNNVIKTVKAFTKEHDRNQDAGKIQAGRYLLPVQISSKVALHMLLDNANQIHNRVTLREGLWLLDYVAPLAKATELPEKDFEAVFAAKNIKDLSLPSWAKKATTAEGFVFPDTYEIPSEPKALDVVKMATKQFNSVVKGLDIEARAKELSEAEGLKLTAYDLVIVASIIEREVNRNEDRAKAARVIYNRLKKGQKLEMDSTVSYAVKKKGVIATTAADRKTDSPYNTYMYKGLPPGPIANPGKKALEAAINPEAGKWLFWCVVNPATGETDFNDDKKGHDASVKKYQNWCQETDENYRICFGKDR
ncbi:MAG: endolytic transglycosylase MltG [Propionibacteriaceae bacterium]|nr:endolytic transglycosylase MltG [Propionibacteriaceae bacterium]